MESESIRSISGDEEFVNKLSNFRIENMNQTISKTDISYLLKFDSKSQIYYSTTNDKSVFFVKSSDNKYNLLTIEDLINSINKTINSGDHYYKIKIHKDLNSFTFSIMRDLVHEISLYCEEILLELKDIGFSINTKVTSQKDRRNNIISCFPPKFIKFVISRNSKFKYSPNEEEKPIFYQTGRGFDIISLSDYIDSLSDYLNKLGYGKCVEDYKYGSDIILEFTLKNQKINFFEVDEDDDLYEEDDDEGEGEDEDDLFTPVR